MKRTMLMVLVAALVATVIGCAGSGQDGKVTMQDGLDALKESGFKGRVRIAVFGNPLSVTSTTGLGVQTHFWAEGEIDPSSVRPGE